MAALQGLLLARREHVRHPRLRPLLLGDTLTVLVLGIVLGIVEMIPRFLGSPSSVGTVVLVALPVVSGLQLLVAVWFDMGSTTEPR